MTTNQKQPQPYQLEYFRPQLENQRGNESACKGGEENNEDPRRREVPKSEEASHNEKDAQGSMDRNTEMHRRTANEERPEDEQARSHCLKEAKHARPTEQMAACNQESKAAAEL